MAYELEGRLHKIYPTESKGDNFQVRDFVVVQDGQYPQYIKFQLSGDKCGLISEIPEGCTVKVSFNIVGREWQDKFFTNLSAWKIKVTAKPGQSGEGIEEAQLDGNPW